MHFGRVFTLTDEQTHIVPSNERIANLYGTT